MAYVSHQSSSLHVLHRRTHQAKRNRFWENVDKTGECWLWTGARSKTGYGQFGRISAHRRSVQIARLELPPRFHVHHECGNRLCVKPEHLKVLSAEEHRLLHAGDAAMCVRGHDLTGLNLRIGPQGNRYCRICDRQRKKRSRRRTLLSDALLA